MYLSYLKLKIYSYNCIFGECPIRPDFQNKGISDNSDQPTKSILRNQHYWTCTLLPVITLLAHIEIKRIRILFKIRMVISNTLSKSFGFEE